MVIDTPVAPAAGDWLVTRGGWESAWASAGLALTAASRADPRIAAATSRRTSLPKAGHLVDCIRPSVDVGAVS